MLEERFELTAAQDVTLELGTVVEVAREAGRNGVPLSSQELPRLSVVDEADVTHHAGALVTLRPGRYRVVAAGDSGSGETWPPEAVVLEAPVEVGAETPRVEVPLVLDAHASAERLALLQAETGDLEADRAGRRYAKPLFPQWLATTLIAPLLEICRG